MAHIIVPIITPKSITVLLIVTKSKTFKRNIPAKIGNIQYAKIATD